ncbi:unnamed protein product, partial [Rotaria sp. Silwood1]
VHLDMVSKLAQIKTMLVLLLPPPIP